MVGHAWCLSARNVQGQRDRADGRSTREPAASTRALLPWDRPKREGCGAGGWEPSGLEKQADFRPLTDEAPSFLMSPH